MPNNGCATCSNIRHRSKPQQKNERLHATLRNHSSKNQKTNSSWRIGPKMLTKPVVSVKMVSLHFLPRSKITNKSWVTSLTETQRCAQNSSRLQTQLPLKLMVFHTKSTELAITSYPTREKNLRLHQQLLRQEQVKVSDKKLKQFKWK